MTPPDVLGRHGALPRTPGFLEAWQRTPNGRWIHVAGGMTHVIAWSCPRLFLTAFVVSVLTIPWRVASPQSPPPFGQECLFGTESPQAGVAGVGFLVGENEGLGGLVLYVVPPVRLHEHGVDLLEIDGLGLVAHRFYQ
jgi:hypothetical protein